jgi:hypothetical protein
MRTFASRNAQGWFILSARYGLLRPIQRVEPYEKTLLSMRKLDRLHWADQVQKRNRRAKAVIDIGARIPQSLISSRRS